MNMGSFTEDNIELKSEPPNYVSEIKLMMHGFGDHSEPMMESAKLIEEVVFNQMQTIIREACKISEIRENSIISAEEILFLLRNDKIKLQRLINYLKLKEFKSSMYKNLESDYVDSYSDFIKVDENPKTSFLKFLSHLDNTGELINDKTLVDHVKKKRCLRIDLMTKKMDEARYLDFSKARCVSFANKNRHKFSDWIGSSGDFTISKSGYLVLGYLAYETVAQIVDLAFLVRHDQNKIQGDYIDRLQFNFPNPITYRPHLYNKSLIIKPLNPAEINEALRRYWSPQLKMTGPFIHWSLKKSHSKLFTF